MTTNFLYLYDILKQNQALPLILAKHKNKITNAPSPYGGHFVFEVLSVKRKMKKWQPIFYISLWYFEAESGTKSILTKKKKLLFLTNGPPLYMPHNYFNCIQSEGECICTMYNEKICIVVIVFFKPQGEA